MKIYTASIIFYKKIIPLMKIKIFDIGNNLMILFCQMNDNRIIHNLLRIKNTMNVSDSYLKLK